MCKNFEVPSKVYKSAVIVKKLDKHFLNSNRFSDFDFFDRQKIHFNAEQPYQFLGRLNYAYDCFLLAMHYDLYLTYYIYYLHFGFGVKTRTTFPIYKFNN